MLQLLLLLFIIVVTYMLSIIYIDIYQNKLYILNMFTHIYWLTFWLVKVLETHFYFQTKHKGNNTSGLFLLVWSGHVKMILCLLVTLTSIFKTPYQAFFDEISMWSFFVSLVFTSKHCWGLSIWFSCIYQYKF